MVCRWKKCCFGVSFLMCVMLCVLLLMKVFGLNGLEVFEDILMMVLFWNLLKFGVF